mmetsp:Transcript_1755/g.3819  ORF Transcript_1755/g.3819 Transcript_1755/m.3819 type:complete len:254 (-) Transcript_1755:313-1074(-)
MDCASKTFSSATVNLSRNSRASCSATPRASSKAAMEMPVLVSVGFSRCVASPKAVDKSMHFCCSASSWPCKELSCCVSRACSASSLAISARERSSTLRTLIASSCFCLCSSSRCCSSSATFFFCSSSNVSKAFSCSCWNTSPLSLRECTSSVSSWICLLQESSSLACSLRAFSWEDTSVRRAFTCSSFFPRTAASSFSISSFMALMSPSLWRSACAFRFAAEASRRASSSWASKACTVAARCSDCLTATATPS